MSLTSGLKIDVEEVGGNAIDAIGRRDVSTLAMEWTSHRLRAKD
jgi:hypothetical protein